MKAVLVVEMPNNCLECPCCYENGGYFKECSCQTMGYRKIELLEKPLWCPLKPLPQKYEEVDGDNDYIYKDDLRMASYLTGVIDGRNSVIDEIMGESE